MYQILLRADLISRPFHRPKFNISQRRSVCVCELEPAVSLSLLELANFCQVNSLLQIGTLFLPFQLDLSEYSTPSLLIHHGINPSQILSIMTEIFVSMLQLRVRSSATAHSSTSKSSSSIVFCAAVAGFLR